MRRLLECLVLAAFSLVTVQTTSAAVPASITVQGKLTDASGVPLPAGPKSFNFKIYGSQAGGAPVWPSLFGEPQVLSSDASGLWIALMGAISPLTETVFADTVRWLEVTVDGVTLPRVRLATGPYAHRVATVDGASGGTITSKVSIGSGHTNTGNDAFVAGANNVASGDYSAVGAGSFNEASGVRAIVEGGLANYATDSFSLVGGGFANTATAPHAVIGGGRANRAHAEFVTIGGGDSNAVSGLGDYATIAGGRRNKASEYAIVGGGQDNQALFYGVVAGGQGNIAGSYSAIGGGRYNEAGLNDATIGGGSNNEALATGATVPGGRRNRAQGINSFAAGAAAYATGDYSFVWNSDPTDTAVSTRSEQFMISAKNGVQVRLPAGGSYNTDLGDIFQDNLIIAWGSVNADGSILADFGVTSITHTVGTGSYRINLDVTTTGNTANNLAVSAILEVDNIPTSAATARLIYANMIGNDGNSFDIFTTNGSHVAVDNQFTFIVTAR